MNKLKNIKAKNKLHFIIFSFILIVAFIVAYPTLCKILMKSNEDTTYWNGQIATSFKEGNGTSSNPYIISTPEEFALLTQFDTQTESYYEITNDLYLNEGVFEYKDGNIIYIKDSTEAIFWGATKLIYVFSFLILQALMDVTVGSLKGMGISFSSML
ncbi:MAG: hypothetical protein IJ966_02740, partial [Bacilli bacterium]|nr:hypothetical protein [Bacilli bacterium]